MSFVSQSYEVESWARQNVSVIKHTGLTGTSTFPQGLFLKCLHKAVITILCLRCLYNVISTVMYLLSSLQVFLQVSLYEDSLHYLYKGISMIVHLLSSLLTSLRCKALQTSLHSSLLVSLQSKFMVTSPLASLWEIFLRCLYEDIPTITSIHSKPKKFCKIFRNLECVQTGKN